MRILSALISIWIQVNWIRFDYLYFPRRYRIGFAVRSGIIYIGWYVTGFHGDNHFNYRNKSSWSIRVTYVAFYRTDLQGFFPMGRAKYFFDYVQFHRVHFLKKITEIYHRLPWSCTIHERFSNKSQILFFSFLIFYSKLLWVVNR